MSRAARLWPWAIGSVLAVTVVANVAVLWEANDDQSQAFEQDYYGKAMRWDSTMAQEGRNAELGWKLAARMERVGAGDARLAVTLTDSSGSAIRHATVTAEAIPIAHAAQVSTLALTEQDGVYQAGFPLVYAGLYEVRLTAVDDGRRFTATVRGTPDGRPFQP